MGDPLECTRETWEVRNSEDLKEGTLDERIYVWERELRCHLHQELSMGISGKVRGNGKDVAVSLSWELEHQI